MSPACVLLSAIKIGNNTQTITPEKFDKAATIVSKYAATKHRGDGEAGLWEINHMASALAASATYQLLLIGLIRFQTWV